MKTLITNEQIKSILYLDDERERIHKLLILLTPLINSYAKDYYRRYKRVLRLNDVDDLKQEINIALLKVISRINIANIANNLFVYICQIIRNTCINIVRKELYKSNSINSFSSSLEYLYEHYPSMLPVEKFTLLHKLITQESIENIFELLNDDGKEILILLLSGMRISKISKEVNLSKVSIYKYIKNKLYPICRKIML